MPRLSKQTLRRIRSQQQGCQRHCLPRARKARASRKASSSERFLFQLMPMCAVARLLPKSAWLSYMITRICSLTYSALLRHHQCICIWLTSLRFPRRPPRKRNLRQELSTMSSATAQASGLTGMPFSRAHWSLDSTDSVAFDVSAAKTRKICAHRDGSINPRTK